MKDLKARVWEKLGDTREGWASDAKRSALGRRRRRCGGADPVLVEEKTAARWRAGQGEEERARAGRRMGTGREVGGESRGGGWRMRGHRRLTHR